MSQRHRFTRIVRILRLEGQTTAERLAETFGVSVRTLYRDIAALRSMGVPVVGEPGIGYHLSESALLDGVRLTPAEVGALLLGARRALEGADPETARAIYGLQRKVNATLPTPLFEALLPDEAANDAEWQKPLRQAG
ncbi:MAG: HTH domain-containing protein [Myxococcales bacterium]|nr:HTH domain-containing protein [Myxococcales bacterium]